VLPDRALWTCIGGPVSGRMLCNSCTTRFHIYTHLAFVSSERAAAHDAYVHPRAASRLLL
jgi:hypothetical protein